MQTRILLLALLILQTSILAAATETDASKVVEAVEPKHWPLSVSTVVDLRQEDVTGKMQKLRAQTRGVLQRVENGMLLVDFGRRGIHWVDPHKSNFLEQAEQVRSGEIRKRFPNFSGQVLSRIASFPQGKSAPISLEDHVRKAGYIVFYPGEYNRECILITHAISSLVNKYPNIQFFTLHSDMRWQGYFTRYIDYLPLFLPHLAEGYTAAFHHEPEPTPSLVAVGTNGQIFYRSETLSADPSMRKSRKETRRSFERRRSSAYQEVEKAVTAIDKL